MSIKRQTDGITSAPAIEQTIRAWTEIHNRESVKRDTFDGRVADLERLCRHHFEPVRVAPGHVSIAFESKEWYAREILREIAEVRDALVRDDGPCAASHAVVVGALAADADARLNWPAVRGWLRYLSQQRQRAKAGAETNRDNAARGTEQLRADVAACRQKHPDWSINNIARDLLRKRRADATKGEISAFAKRIARLRRKK